MPYIGNSHIVGDHINNFKVLDDISSYTATFDGSSTDVVSTANETLRIVEHRFVQGQRVTYNNGGGSNIGGLSSGTAYYVSFDTTNTIKLATSLANANTNNVINLTSAGGGTTHTLTAAFDGTNTKFKLTHNSGESGRFNNATQLQVAINNVLQRPNSDPDSFTEGFAVERGNKIVFQTAPTSNDVFWGSIIANSLPTFDIDATAVDNFTGDGSTTDFTLSRIPPNSASIIVTINGVFQHLSDTTTVRAYSLEASVVKFTSAPANGDEIQVRHTGFRGATSDSVTGFYGRTGNVTLTASDDILTRNINSSGIVTATSFIGSGANLTGIDATAVKDTSGNVKIQAQASGAVYTGIHTFTTLKSTSADFSGNVSIAGTLTYEDVKNVDSVGLGTFREGIFLPDGKKALFGNAASNGDLEIYHSGSHSYIQNKTNFLFIHSNSLALRSLSQETFIDCSLNGSVDLYYDNAKKLETVNTGINLTGGAYATGTFTAGSNIKATTDGGYLSAGASDDIRIYHDGSNSYLNNNTGILKITGVSGQKIDFMDGSAYYARFNSGSQVDLFHNNSAKFATQSYGASVNGSIRLTTGGDGYTFISDSDTGMHNPFNGGLNFKVNASDRLTINNAGIATFSNVNVEIKQDLDVDGHTNLDNLSVAGVSTFTGNADFSNAIDVTGDSTFSNQITLKKIRLNNSNSAMYWGTGAQNFRDSAAIGVAGATNFHVTGSAANDFCVSAKNGTRLVFGSGAGAISATQKRAQIDSDGTFRILKSLILSNNLNVAGITTITQDLDVDGHTNLDNVSIAGVVTATSYYGDGSNLSNVISGVDVKFEGASVGTGVTMLNFVGFNTVTPPASGLSTITSGQNLTIGVRSGSAVEASLTGTSFNVIARSGGNISINI